MKGISHHLIEIAQKRNVNQTAFAFLTSEFYNKCLRQLEQLEIFGQQIYNGKYAYISFVMMVYFFTLFVLSRMSTIR